jgi:hypothetical protein
MQTQALDGSHLYSANIYYGLVIGGMFGACLLLRMFVGIRLAKQSGNLGQRCLGIYARLEKGLVLLGPDLDCMTGCRSV